MLLFFLCFIRKDLNLNFANENYKKIFVENGIVTVVSTIITFILNGLLSSDFKAKLVFWKKENIYPGCRAFTDLLYRDCRIDKFALRQKYGELPIQPQDQNKLWYKMYKKMSLIQ